MHGQGDELRVEQYQTSSAHVAQTEAQRFNYWLQMLFCPTCANLLVISSEAYNKWACNTCAYEFPITKQVRPKDTSCQHKSKTGLNNIHACTDDLQDKAQAQGDRRRPWWRRDVETRRLHLRYACTSSAESRRAQLTSCARQRRATSATTTARISTSCRSGPLTSP